MIILTTYPPTITFGDVIINVLVWGFVIQAYRKRNSSEASMKLWNGIKLFFGVLLLTLGANYAKKGIKTWWNKD